MKRFTSAILVIFMLAGVFCFNTFASETENDFFVYVSASMYGEFLTDINGEKTVCTKLELGDGEVYTLDDVFVAFHDSLYEGGSEGGYETAIGDYGQYITKFWGDTSGNFTYQLNGISRLLHGRSLRWVFLRSRSCMALHLLQEYNHRSRNRGTRRDRDPVLRNYLQIPYSFFRLQFQRELKCSLCKSEPSWSCR